MNACVQNSPSAPQTLLGQSQDVVTQRLQRFSLEQLRSYASTCDPYDALFSKGVIVGLAQWVKLSIYISLSLSLALALSPLGARLSLVPRYSATSKTRWVHS